MSLLFNALFFFCFFFCFLFFRSNSDLSFRRILHALLNLNKVGEVLIMAAHNAETDFFGRGHDDGPKILGRSQSYSEESPSKKLRREEVSQDRSRLTMESLKAFGSSSPASSKTKSSPVPSPSSSRLLPSLPISSHSSDLIPDGIVGLSPPYLAQEKAVLKELRVCLERVFDTASKLKGASL